MLVVSELLYQSRNKRLVMLLVSLIVENGKLQGVFVYRHVRYNPILISQVVSLPLQSVIHFVQQWTP